MWLVFKRSSLVTVLIAWLIATTLRFLRTRVTVLYCTREFHVNITKGVCVSKRGIRRWKSEVVSTAARCRVR